jgi:outer membrane protein assembly factor BamB
MIASTANRFSVLSSALRSLTLAIALVSSNVWAGDFPNGWRGDTSGVWPNAKPPIVWDGPSGKNIRWKVQLPSHSIASPVFGSDRLLALSEPDRVQCYSLADGTLLWEDRLSAIDVVAPEPERQVWREKFAEAWLLFHKGDPYFSGGLIQVQRIGDEAQRKRCEYLFTELKKVQLDPPLGWDVCGYTAATPVAAADRVIVRHCSNVICCYDWNGKRVWLARANPGNDPKRYGGCGSLMEFSPLQILDDMVICNWIPTLEEMGLKRGDTINYLYCDKSAALPAERLDNRKSGPRGYAREALVAFDLATGKERWRSDWLRTGGAMSYAFVPMTVDGVRLIVTGGGEVVRARDGKVVLRDLGWGGYANCPVVARDPATGKENLLVWCEGAHWYAPRYGQWVYVQRIIRKGDGFAAEKIWEWGWGAGVPNSHHPRSPVVKDGKIFLGDHLGFVMDLATGNMIYGPRTKPDDRGRFADWRGGLLATSDYLNPLIAGQYLYLPQGDGSAKVAMTDLDAKGQPLILHHNFLGRAVTKKQPYTAEERRNYQTVATPNIWQNCLYIRTHKWLWCIGSTER